MGVMDRKVIRCRRPPAALRSRQPREVERRGRAETARLTRASLSRWGLRTSTSQRATSSGSKPMTATARVVSRPVGGVLSAGWTPHGAAGGVAIHLSGPPGDIGRAARPRFGLAPGGVYRAARVTSGAGALLPHPFTLACARLHVPSAVCSLWHFPAGRPDWPLASTLPCGAPTFLSCRLPLGTAHRGHPAGSPRPPLSHGSGKDCRE